MGELGPMFFSVSETGSDIHTKKRQEQEHARQMEYQQKLRDDLDRQAKEEEAQALLHAGGQVVDIGSKRDRTKLQQPVSLVSSTDTADAANSDSDGAVQRRRKKAAGNAGGGGGPRRRMMMTMP